MPKVSELMETIKNFDPNDEVTFTIVDARVELHVIDHKTKAVSETPTDEVAKNE